MIEVLTCYKPTCSGCGDSLTWDGDMVAHFPSLKDAYEYIEMQDGIVIYDGKSTGPCPCLEDEEEVLPTIRFEDIPNDVEPQALDYKCYDCMGKWTEDKVLNALHDRHVALALKATGPNQ